MMMGMCAKVLIWITLHLSSLCNAAWTGEHSCIFGYISDPWFRRKWLSDSTNIQALPKFSKAISGLNLPVSIVQIFHT